MSNLSLLQQYELLTGGKGFAELANWSTVVLTGEDRVSFLQNMCTNDIKALKLGASCEAFCTDVKGKIVSYFLVTAGEDRLVLLMVPEQAETLIAHLDRYLIREDVQLIDATNELDWFCVVSGEAHTDWSDGEGIPHIRTGIYASGAASLLAVEPENRERTRETMTACGLAECSLEAWQIVRIEDGLPLFGVDFDSTNLPQEVNRDHAAISFNKGCYLGQETVARIDALGHVNQKLVSMKFTGEEVPSVGMELRSDDKPVGRVTSSCWSPRENAPLAIGWVRRGSNDEGSQLQSDCGEATVTTGD